MLFPKRLKRTNWIMQNWGEPFNVLTLKTQFSLFWNGKFKNSSGACKCSVVSDSYPENFSLITLPIYFSTHWLWFCTLNCLLNFKWPCLEFTHIHLSIFHPNFFEVMSMSSFSQFFQNPSIWRHIRLFNYIMRDYSIEICYRSNSMVPVEPFWEML